MTAAVYSATMNTSFPSAPPPATDPSPPQPVSFAQQPRYVEQISGQFTPPVSGSATPSTTSPVSPRSTWNLPPHLQPRVQQIRPPKSPMYVPAVLRPTEKPPRHSPPKNDGASTKYGSPESIGEGSTPVQTSAGPMPQGVSRIVTEEWNEEALGKVTGRPSRDHWKPDSSSPTCNSPRCSRPFTLLTRRHHCRRCGSIFCSQHSPYTIPLDHHAKFHPQGTLNRACEACFNDYRAWEVARISRSNSETSREGHGPGSLPTTPTVGVPKRAGEGFGGLVGSIAQSVPRDWNWSTF